MHPTQICNVTPIEYELQSLRFFIFIAAVKDIIIIYDIRGESNEATRLKKIWRITSDRGNFFSLRGRSPLLVDKLGGDLLATGGEGGMTPLPANFSEGFLFVWGESRGQRPCANAENNSPKRL